MNLSKTNFGYSLILAATFMVSSVESSSYGQSLKSHSPDNFFIGGALHGDASFQNAGCRDVAEKNFNAVTATAYLPWGDVWNDPSVDPDFKHFHAVVDWAVARDIKIHGHVLVFPWANEQSGWWKQLPLEKTEACLKSYVTALVKTRAGKVWTWDVVNEVMANDDEAMDADGLRVNYKEYRAMGASYVDKAFFWAAAADPNAKLILNTTGCEQFNNKSTRLYEFVRKLISRGVPVHGIGFQSHFVDVTSPAPDIEGMRRNFQRFADLGLEIHMTEVDVCAIRTRDPHPRHPGVSTPDQSQLDRQKRFFDETLKLALSMPACKSYLLWDFADDYSWLHKTNSQIYNVGPGVYTYPTPFWGGKTCELSPKPTYDAMLETLRSSVGKRR